MNEDEIISNSILENSQKEKLTEEQLEEKKKKIKKQQNKFKKIFKQLDKDTLELVQNLINELAFMSVTLEDNRKHME